MDNSTLYKTIIRPILTEKATILKEEGKYMFEVSTSATKSQIKTAVEKIFKVKVESVATINYKPKKKRMGRFLGLTSSEKRAVVTLKKGQTITELEGV